MLQDCVLGDTKVVFQVVFVLCCGFCVASVVVSL